MSMSNRPRFCSHVLTCSRNAVLNFVATLTFHPPFQYHGLAVITHTTSRLPHFKALFGTTRPHPNPPALEHRPPSTQPRSHPHDIAPEYGTLTEDWSKMNQWNVTFVPNGLSRECLEECLRRDLSQGVLPAAQEHAPARCEDVAAQHISTGNRGFSETKGASARCVSVGANLLQDSSG